MNQNSDNCQPALGRKTRSNHPQSAPGSARRPRRHQPIFPRILREPRKCATLLLTTAIRARGPAATRHFATHEHRLPILPMSPNHAERTAALPARPGRIRPPAEPVNLPHFRQSPFFVRLRSSQIVRDRLRSSEIVSDRPNAPPPTARHSRRIAEMSARFCQPNRQECSSFRVKTRHFSPILDQMRPQTPVRNKVFPRHLVVVDTANGWSTKVGIYSMPAFSSNFGSPNSWRADHRASRSRQLCPSQESDELYFRHNVNES